MAFHSRTLPPLMPSHSPLQRYYDPFEWYTQPSSSSISFVQDPQSVPESANWQYAAYPVNGRAAAPVPSQASLYEPRTQKTLPYDGPAPPGLVHPNHSQSFTQLHSAPTVAEISSDDYFYDEPAPKSHSTGDLQQFDQQPESQPAKVPQDSSAGGVSAHLDYDMDQMASFVTTEAQRLVFGSTSSVPGFRKFVSQVLTSTRLPSSTILLAMSYMRSRVNYLYDQGSFGFSEQDLYHVFTVSLLLASKFLDDNTFQNKSWAEVTRIEVKIINNLELEWMMDNDWRLGLFSGVTLRLWQGWESLWNSHVARQKEEVRQAEQARVAEQARAAAEELKIKQAIQSLQNNCRRQSVPHIRVQPVPYTPDPWAHMYSSQNTPPSAPDTAPPTPEYWAASGGDWGHTSTVSLSPYNTLPSSVYSSISAKSNHGTPAPSWYDPLVDSVTKHSFNPWHQPDCSCKASHRPSSIYPSWTASIQPQHYHSVILGQA